MAQLIIHAEGVFLGWIGGAGDIIHAVGVRFGFPSPRRSRTSGVGGERRGGLACWHDPFELVAEIFEILGAVAKTEHFAGYLGGDKPVDGTRPVAAERPETTRGV